MKPTRRSTNQKTGNATVAKEDVNVKTANKHPRLKKTQAAKRRTAPGKRLMDFTG